MPMTVWTMVEIEAAEAADQAFAARLADAAERKARRALNKAIRNSPGHGCDEGY